MPDKHPILIFNDIKFEQLKSLVAFIYNGSVNISENNIHAFLNAAQSLLIKGLSEETKDEEKTAENIKRPTRNVEIQDMKTSCKKNNTKLFVPKKPDCALDPGRSFKKQRHILPKVDESSFLECDESLFKLQEISITKYTQQNLNSKPSMRKDLENKVNEPIDERMRAPENYVVKSWKHNSVEDLNGRLKQNKNNTIKRQLERQLDKPTNCRNEDREQENKKRVLSEHTNLNSDTGNYADRSKPEETGDKIKKEIEAEQVMIVEPKQEIIEEEDTNSEEYSLNASNNDSIAPDPESLYESRSISNYHHQSAVDRGIPVPLLMCRTSLSESDSIEPNWIPSVAGNFASDHTPLVSSIDNNAQDLQCRTCAQDLPCPTCTKKYKSRYALNRHILYECGKARKSFSCDECGKKVTRQDTLQKHKLIHLVQHLKEKEGEKRKKKEERR